MINLDDFAPVKTDGSNWFAWNTMKNRIPAIIKEVIERNPHFPKEIKTELQALKTDLLEDAQIPPLEAPAWDYELWEAARSEQIAETNGAVIDSSAKDKNGPRGKNPEREVPTWLDAQWFFAETFLYRHIIQTVRYWEFGWDPFWPYKEEELNGPNIRQLINTGLEITGPREEKLEGLLGLALWGNRIDLSYKESMSHGSDLLDEDDLVINDAQAVVEKLLSVGSVNAGGTPRIKQYKQYQTNGSGIGKNKTDKADVHLVTDNAGPELASDLVLADYLLHELGLTVWFHVKLYPTYVSDATAFDVLEHIRRIKPAPLGERLETSLRSGRLRVIPDQFWNSSYFLDRLPDRLNSVFSEAALVIFKGDVNYRRVLHDAVLPPEGSFSDAVSFFPAPLLALRTLKSDCITGLAPGQSEELDAKDKTWRNNGKYGIIQFADR